MLNAYHNKENIWCNVYNIVPYQYVQIILIHFHSYRIFHYANDQTLLINALLMDFFKWIFWLFVMFWLFLNVLCAWLFTIYILYTFY